MDWKGNNKEPYKSITVHAVGYTLAEQWVVEDRNGQATGLQWSEEIVPEGGQYMPSR